MRRMLGVFAFLLSLAGASMPAAANSNDQAQMTANDALRCMALNIYFEARGEPFLGKIAVGHVVLNRIAHSRYPSNACDVIRQGGERRRHRCQFSWWCDGRSDNAARPRIRPAVRCGITPTPSIRAGPAICCVTPRSAGISSTLRRS